MKVTIYWTQTATPHKRLKICSHFGIPFGMSVNRETDAEVNHEQYTTLLETEQLGYIQIRNKNDTTQRTNQETTCRKGLV